jgi:hypothetical protein
LRDDAGSWDVLLLLVVLDDEDEYEYEDAVPVNAVFAGASYA